MDTKKFHVGSLGSHKLNGFSEGIIWRWKISGVIAYKLAKLFLPRLHSAKKRKQLRKSISLFEKHRV